MNPKNHTIRLANPEDAPQLATAQREIAKIPGRLASLPEEIKDSAIREKIMAFSQSESGICLVMEKEGVVIGHAFLEPHKLAVTAHVVFLTIAIHEGHQGMGLGKMLMQKLLEWARSQSKIEKVELQVRSSNTAAIQLYKGLGFVEEGRKTKRLKYGPDNYQDDIYMALWVGD